MPLHAYKGITLQGFLIKSPLLYNQNDNKSQNSTVNLLRFTLHTMSEICRI